MPQPTNQILFKDIKQSYPVIVSEKSNNFFYEDILLVKFQNNYGYFLKSNKVLHDDNCLFSQSRKEKTILNHQKIKKEFKNHDNVLKGIVYLLHYAVLNMKNGNTQHIIILLNYFLSIHYSYIVSDNPIIRNDKEVIMNYTHDIMQNWCNVAYSAILCRQHQQHKKFDAVTYYDMLYPFFSFFKLERPNTKVILNDTQDFLISYEKEGYLCYKYSFINNSNETITCVILNPIMGLSVSLGQSRITKMDSKKDTKIIYYTGDKDNS